jgi:hypothetical protein
VPDPTSVPAKKIRTPETIVRVGRRGCTWELPRRFSGFRAAPPDEIGIVGAAPKWVLISKNQEHPENLFIAKKGQKWGTTETYTELFVNQLGTLLGLQIAHSGLVKLDGELHFITRNFCGPDETLTHFSRMVESHFGDALKTIIRNNEQEFYTIDLVIEILKGFCAENFDIVFPDFIDMLVFDCLVGSMDRHVENWGVIVSTRIPRHFRFAPICDTARALFWNCDNLARLS